MSIGSDLASTGLFVRITIAKGSGSDSEVCSEGVSIIQDPWQFDEAVSQAVEHLLRDHLRNTLIDSQQKLREIVSGAAA